MQEQNDIKTQFRQQQEKYIYYIIALCVAAIGYSLNIIRDSSFVLSQLPLYIAVIAWGVSVYLGLKRIRYTISILYAQNDLIKATKKRFRELNNDTNSIDKKIEGINQAIIKNNSIAELFFKWQWYLFLLGFGLFILWHILEMCIKTIC